MDWTSLLATLGSTGIIVAAGAWLLKSLGTLLFAHLGRSHEARLEKGVQAHKDQLALTSEKELLRLRAITDASLAEHRVRFESLHAQQAEVVAEVFAKLEETHLAFRSLVSFFQPADVDMRSRADDAWKAFQAFQRYYFTHAIWLDRSTCDAINEVLNRFHNAFVDMTLYLEDEGVPRNRERMMKAFNAITEEIPTARRALDEGFRRLLGVEGAQPLLLPEPQFPKLPMGDS